MIKYCLYCGNELVLLRKKYCNSQHSYRHKKYGLNKQKTEDIDNYKRDQRFAEKIKKMVNKEVEKNKRRVVRLDKGQKSKVKYLRRKLKQDIRFHSTIKQIDPNYAHSFQSSSIDALRSLIGLKDNTITLKPEIFIIQEDGTKKCKNIRRN